MPPFKRIHREIYTFTHPAANSLAQNEGIKVEGLMFALQVRVANFASAANLTLTIQDKDGYEIYNSGPVAKNTNSNLLAANVYLPVPVDSGCSMIATINASAGSGGGVSEAIAWIDGYKSGQ